MLLHKDSDNKNGTRCKMLFHAASPELGVGGGGSVGTGWNRKGCFSSVGVPHKVQKIYKRSAPYMHTHKCVPCQDLVLVAPVGAVRLKVRQEKIKFKCN